MVGLSADFPDTTVEQDGRGGIDPLQDDMDEDQELSALEPLISGVAFGDHGHRNGECSWFLRFGPTFMGLLSLSLLVVGTSDTGQREVESTEVSRGTCRHDGVRSLLSCSSRQESS